MGFKVKKKLYKLVFADEDMQGLEVTMTSVPTGHLLRLQELSSAGSTAVAKDSGTFRELIELLAGAMLSWNLEDDDDQAVPVSVESLLAQDPDFLMEIISAWTIAITGVSAPLDGGSTSGDGSLEASIPMEPLSPSHPS